MQARLGACDARPALAEIEQQLFYRQALHVTNFFRRVGIPGIVDPFRADVRHRIQVRQPRAARETHLGLGSVAPSFGRNDKIMSRHRFFEQLGKGLG